MQGSISILAQGMRRGNESQSQNPNPQTPTPPGPAGSVGPPGSAPVKIEAILPNPKLKLLDQLREVMRLKHYSIRTERS